MQTVTRHEILRVQLQDAIALESKRYRLLEIARRTVASHPPGTPQHRHAALAAGFFLTSYRKQRDQVIALSRQVGAL